MPLQKPIVQPVLLTESRAQESGELLDELRAPYPDFRDLVDSTAAARLNGFLGGARTHDRRCEDLGQLGLSEAGQRILVLNSP